MWYIRNISNYLHSPGCHNTPPLPPPTHLAVNNFSDGNQQQSHRIMIDDECVIAEVIA